MCQALGYLPISDLTQVGVKEERQRIKPRVSPVCTFLCRVNAARGLSQVRRARGVLLPCKLKPAE